jgi:hypothetical protein
MGRTRRRGGILMQIQTFPRIAMVHITLPQDCSSYDWGTLTKIYEKALKDAVKKATGKDFYTTANSSEGNVLYVNQRGVGGGWSDETAQMVRRAMLRTKPPYVAGDRR